VNEGLTKEMNADDLPPQPQAQPPRSRLAWVWTVLIYGLSLSTCGFFISGFMAILHEPHLQIIGSGRWRYGAMAVGALLYALIGFSGKVSALVTKRMPMTVLPPARRLLDFTLEGIPSGVRAVVGVCWRLSHSPPR
jgi:hypothetical protein